MSKLDGIVLPARRKEQEVSIDLEAGIAKIRIDRRSGDARWVLIDVADLPLVARFTWWLDMGGGGRTPYASTTVRVDGKGRANLLMHRLILDPGEMHVDHVDGNGLDNRRSNLRAATQSQNRANERVPRVNSASRYKGVTRSPSALGGWCAQCIAAGKLTHLGTFDREIDAALAYDDAARAEFGEFACTNFDEAFAASAVRLPRRPRHPGPRAGHGTSRRQREACLCPACCELLAADRQRSYDRQYGTAEERAAKKDATRAARDRLDSELAERYSAGESLPQIASATGMAKTTVREHVIRGGAALRTIGQARALKGGGA